MLRYSGGVLLCDSEKLRPAASFVFPDHADHLQPPLRLFRGRIVPCRLREKAGLTRALRAFCWFSPGGEKIPFASSSVLAFDPSHLVAKTLVFSARLDGRVPTDACMFPFFCLFVGVLLMRRWVVFFSNYVTPLVWSDNSQRWLQKKNNKLAPVLFWAVNVKSLFASHGKVLQTGEATRQQAFVWKERFTKWVEIRVCSLSLSKFLRFIVKFTAKLYLNRQFHVSFHH